MPVLSDAYLKWFNGYPTLDKTLAFGWHIDAGLNPVLDDTLEAMGMQRYIVEHRNPDKNGNTHKPYWHVAPCSLIVVAEGARSPKQMDKTEQRTGIAYARQMELDNNKQPVRYDTGARNIKYTMTLKVRVLIHELVNNGYSETLPLVLSGNIVDCMIEALAKQGDVLKAYYGYTGEGAPFYGFSLPLVASETRKMVGVPPQQSAIYPMLAALPATLDEAYIVEHAVSEGLVEYIREFLLGETITWSFQESARMRAIGQEFAEKPSTLQPGTASRSLPSGNGDQALVQKLQIDWIAAQYCRNDQSVIAQVCQAFNVESLEQLTMSQFRQLVTTKQQAERQRGQPQQP